MSDDNCPECKWTYYPYCICPELKDAFRRGVDSVTLTVVSDMYRKGYTAGYNAHATAALEWKATHGAYPKHGKGENP